ncbi:polymorphic toxin-type HINT domain-containing protein [Paenibacillus sp. UMB4589-SE434]|uniref:polymorphic toxin-type HINT domain-containing protein n=1 Tax=Paenibacillus sp. UMB4589-SE434 TaxID=3046314 RepID=UPI00254DB1BD|nr:polymorphic toxin-type HINT domain-containing protein [Paenibacillus sp. UMB4589-SE434]MDK8183738.1 polymorphic toxin-type HINT domain-containing protein [Paenibacillus sp. UMB4589-SE434]
MTRYWQKARKQARRRIKPWKRPLIVQAEEVYVIEVKQEKITTTKEHPFWIAGKGWVEAGDLSVGDKLVDRDGQE